MTYFWVGEFGVFKSSSRRIAVVTVYTSTAHPNLLFRSECSTLKSVIQVLVHGLLVHHHSICYAWLALTRGMFGQHELLRVGGCQFTRPLGNIYIYIYGQGLTLRNHPQSLSLHLPWHVMADALAAVVRNELVFVSHCNGCLQLTRCAGSALDPLPCWNQ